MVADSRIGPFQFPAFNGKLKSAYGDTDHAFWSHMHDQSAYQVIATKLERLHAFGRATVHCKSGNFLISGFSLDMVAGTQVVFQPTGGNKNDLTDHQGAAELAAPAESAGTSHQRDLILVNSYDRDLHCVLLSPPSDMSSSTIYPKSGAR